MHATGVRVHRVRNLLLLVTGSALRQSSPPIAGPVAFIGLAMPHVARMIMRTDNHWILIPATMLSGAAVALRLQRAQRPAGLHSDTGQRPYSCSGRAGNPIRDLFFLSQYFLERCTSMHL